MLIEKSQRRAWIRSWARRLLFPSCEALWSAAFLVSRAVLRPRLQPVNFTGHDRVLVVAPHPDDETIGCGGAIVRHSAAGDKVHVCMVTDGAGSRAGGLKRAEMRAKRAGEAIRAVRRLGNVELLRLNLPEWHWQEDQLVDLLRGLIAKLQPSIIYTTSAVDYHPEHVRVAHCLARALTYFVDEHKMRVRLYEVQVPFTPVLANLACELPSKSLAAKARALRAYSSQKQSLVWLPRYARYQQRLYGAQAPLEVFCELPLRAYIAVHGSIAGGSDEGRVTKGVGPSSFVVRRPPSPPVFRGIGPRPFTDPAAWLVGAQARANLKRLIGNVTSSNSGPEMPSEFSPGRPSNVRRAVRRAGKKLLAIRYRRFSPDSEPNRVVHVAGLRLHVLKGVFNPSMHFTSDVFARYIMERGAVPPGASVLDLGTGTGVLGIAAARAGAGTVVSIDVNPQAVRCATLNVHRNDLQRQIRVKEGDLFAPVQSDRFGLVLCNPPYFTGEPRTIAERAFYGGPELEWVRRFGLELHAHLQPGGSAIISIGDAADIGAVLRLLADCGWHSVQIEKRDRIVEIVYLFRLTESIQNDKDKA